MSKVVWLITGLAALLTLPAASGGGWSASRSLATCGVTAVPQIAFPSASPTEATGPGAIVWIASQAGCGRARAGHAAQSLSIAWLGPGDRPSRTVRQAVSASRSPSVLADGTSLGRVAVAAPTSTGSTAVLQGRAPNGLSAAATLAGDGGAVAIARAYLGDAAVASVRAGRSIAVDVERHYLPAFNAPRRVPIAAGPVTALTVTLDYRSDVLVAWQQNGFIWADVLRASGARAAVQRVGPSGPDPQLQAVVSDDDRGMVAWSSGVGTRTSVSFALSGTGVRFDGFRVLASYADPHGAGRQGGSLALVRLAEEDVLLAWTTVQNGHYAVLEVPAVFAGVRTATRLTQPGTDAILAALAPGPDNEAVALWREASQLWAARTVIAGASVAVNTPALVADSAAGAEPAFAVDPANDRPVAAWVTPGGGLAYAVGPRR